MTAHGKRMHLGRFTLAISTGLLICLAVAHAHQDPAPTGANQSGSALVGGTVPKYFSVSQNYPNPFNGVTRLNYQLPTESDVQVFVYNILGTRVRRLMSRTQQAGSYEMRWNGRNDLGDVLPSGPYFVVFLTNDNYMVRKVIMIK